MKLEVRVSDMKERKFKIFKGKNMNDASRLWE